MSEKESSWARAVRHADRSDQKETDERYTPEWILNLVTEVMEGIDLDPCADPRKRVPAQQHFTKQDDGLEQVWSGKVFLNPPFSDSSSWLRHLSIYVASGAVSEAIVLLPVMALSNKAAQLLMRSMAEGFVLTDRRLSFLDHRYEQMGEVNPFPFALVYVGSRFDRFLKVMGEVGIPCAVQKAHSLTKPKSCQYCGKIFHAKRTTAKFCSSTCRVESHRKHRS